MSELPKRRLGRSDMWITPVGVGTAPLASTPDWWVYWGPQDEAESIRAIQAALDVGINWIDTAPFYGWGRAEEIIGKAIRGRREQVYLFTKCGTLPDGLGGSYEDLRPETIRTEVENSLRRLGVDVIDLLQFHDPDPETPIESSWETVQALIAEGKVRYAGLSNHPPELVSRAGRIGMVTAVQHQYNLLRPQAEREILPLARRNQIGFLAWGPLAAGFLVDDFDLARLDPDDFRHQHPFGQETAYSKIRESVAALTAVAQAHGRTMVELAVAWILRQPAVSGAIVGIRNEAEAAALPAALDWTLSHEDEMAVEAALAAWRR
ncbi:MAG: aldo/keto reductase [Anaerolineales bacterium]|nr:aldo/keto reductase [Anaerolineales bacterium]